MSAPRICPMCPAKTPVVSPRLAGSIARRTEPAGRLEVISRAAGWLIDRGHGPTLYLGVVGRDYFIDERLAIVAELYLLESAPCPFQASYGCVLGGCATEPEWYDEAAVPPWGWLPTLLLKQLDPALLRSLAASKQIADAKLAALNWRGAFPLPRWSTNQPYIVPAPDLLVVRHGDDIATTTEEKTEVVPHGTGPPSL